MSISQPTEWAIELQMKRWVVDAACDHFPDMDPRYLRVHRRVALDLDAEMWRYTFTAPVKMLQDDVEVSRLPIGRWDYFLCAIGLAKYAKFEVTRITECLVFTDKSLKLDTDQLKFMNRLHINIRKERP
jgi:hypothetical protein